jgi:hypothetical protein
MRGFFYSSLQDAMQQRRQEVSSLLQDLRQIRCQSVSLFLFSVPPPPPLVPSSGEFEGLSRNNHSMTSLSIKLSCLA